MAAHPTQLTFTSIRTTTHYRMDEAEEEAAAPAAAAGAAAAAAAAGSTEAAGPGGGVGGGSNNTKGGSGAGGARKDELPLIVQGLLSLRSPSVGPAGALTHGGGESRASSRPGSSTSSVVGGGAAPRPAGMMIVKGESGGSTTSAASSSVDVEARVKPLSPPEGAQAPITVRVCVCVCVLGWVALLLRRYRTPARSRPATRNIDLHTFVFLFTSHCPEGPAVGSYRNPPIRSIGSWSRPKHT
jgi:hypothetical protein